jgi:ABC-type Fe3+-siderophore transport system permease subunit
MANTAKVAMESIAVMAAYAFLGPLGWVGLIALINPVLAAMIIANNALFFSALSEQIQGPA